MADGKDNYNCVVDASVGIKLFLIEPLSERADALFTRLTDDPPSQFYVPDLFFIECTNILWKYVQRFGYASDTAKQDVASLIRLPLQVVPTATLAEEALDLAVQHGSTAYDSAYIVLARELSLPLVTADEALARRFEGTGLDVRFLDDWPGQ
jgi:predicted nucleic acid-binding protein